MDSLNQLMAGFGVALTPVNLMWCLVGTTLGTWYLNGAVPIEVTCTTDIPKGLLVDEHSITVARYAFGLSTFETRWGTFTDPWTHQPQPKCGFVLKGKDGTIAAPATVFVLILMDD